MNPLYRFLIAGAAFGAASSGAHAGLSELYVAAGSSNHSYIEYEKDSQRDADSDSYGQFFPKGSDFTSNWAWETDAMVSLGGQGAYSKSVSTLGTDSSGFAYTSTVDFGADLGSSGIRSTSSAAHHFDAQMMFDSDTEIEFFYRVDFEPSDTSFQYAFAVISGLRGTPTQGLDAGDSSSSGYYMGGYRAVAPAGEWIYLEAQIFGETDTDYGNPVQYSGSYTLTTIVRVVPAPGGLGVLAGIGLLSARRRR